VASAAPTPSPSSSASAPGASAGSAAPVDGTIDTPEEALAAVALVAPQYLGYGPRDLDVIGQSSWVDTSRTAEGFEITFVTGSGDCPAGCIEHQFARYEVRTDGTVRLLCEWRSEVGVEAEPSPC
jgi:hypothetical protein